MNLNITIDKQYDVKVIRLLSKGIVVADVNDNESTAFIHKSKISKQYVDDLANFVDVGDVFTATCVPKSFAEDATEGELSLLDLNIQRRPKHRVPSSESLNTMQPANANVSSSATACVNNDRLSSNTHKSLDKMIEEMHKSSLSIQQDLSSRRKRRLR